MPGVFEVKVHVEFEVAPAVREEKAVQLKVRPVTGYTSVARAKRDELMKPFKLLTTTVPVLPVVAPGLKPALLVVTI